MIPYVRKMHTTNGLFDEALKSTVTMEQAEDRVINFLKNECGLKKGKWPIAGSSCHVDKKFIEKDMPRLHKFLHYRIIDLSSVFELTKRWLPDLANEARQFTYEKL